MAGGDGGGDGGSGGSGGSGVGASSGGGSGGSGGGSGGGAHDGETFEEWLSRSTRQHEQRVEINLQLGEYSASAQKQMKVLPGELVTFEDFRTVFGADAIAASFQSAEVKTTSHRTWLRLVGRRHDLHWWSSPQSYSAHIPFHRMPLRGSNRERVAGA